MPKKSSKSKSKRLTLRQKHKIVRKVKEHQKKKRRELKKLEAAGKGRKKTLKDPGIPSQWPFKDELIAELQAKRLDILAQEQAKKDAKKQRKLDARAAAAGLDDEMMEDGGGDLAALAALQARAAGQHEDFAGREGAGAGPSGGRVYSDRDNSRRAFYKEFKKVVELSDVIIEVLDARDPMSCRCTEVERYIRSVSSDKKIILLLNKIDLVPREVVEQWLKYFREELPAVAFKCSTQKEAERIKYAKKSSLAEGATQGADALGADTLLQLLKNFCRNKDIKTAITVGIVGLPNVGKSSLINSLMRSRSVSVGNMPGVTKSVQEVHLDKNIKLLDSPGIVFTMAENEGAAALRNCIKVEKLEDPITPINEIMKRVPARQLMMIYKVPQFQTTEQFLSLIAKSRGKLFRGGTPDLQAAARVVLGDWNNGKIPYYTNPPRRGDGKHESAAVVSAWGQEFDADAVFAAERSAVIAGLPSLDEGLFVATETVGAAQADLQALTRAQETGQDLDVALDELINLEQGLDAFGGSGSIGGASKAAKMARDAQNRALFGELGQFNPKAAKAEKRRRRKGMEEAEEGMIDEDAAFDFEEAFAGAESEGDEEEEGDEDEDEESGEEEEESEEEEEMEDDE